MFNNKNEKISIKPAALFSALFVLIIYAVTSCPVVPPYRDSGELITSAYTLSIAHSPGYPAYMVLGKSFITIAGFFGMNPAAAMNLLSGIAGAAAV